MLIPNYQFQLSKTKDYANNFTNISKAKMDFKKLTQFNQSIIQKYNYCIFFAKLKYRRLLISNFPLWNFHAQYIKSFSTEKNIEKIFLPSN